MLIGIDFDNTIVSYDGIFCTVAKERGHLPANLAMNKTQLRDRLRAEGREAVWTEMQGYVYGKRMRDAMPFPGVMDFFAFSKRAGIPVAIISHRTRHPYQGPKSDLHAAARRWLRKNLITDKGKPALEEGRVFFECSKEDKLRRIAQQGCTHFVDDLPEFLLDPAFPGQVDRILFDPEGCHAGSPHFHIARSWQDIRAMAARLRRRSA